MSPLILSLLTFLATILLVAGIYSIVSDVYLRDRSRVARRVDDEFRKKLRARAEKSMLFKDLREFSADAAAGDKPPTLRQRFEAMVEQSGLELTPSRLLAIAAGSSLGLAFLGALLRRDPISAAVGAIIGAVVPVFYVNLKRNQRQ